MQGLRKLSPQEKDELLLNLHEGGKGVGKFTAFL